MIRRPAAMLSVLVGVLAASVGGLAPPGTLEAQTPVPAVLVGRVRSDSTNLPVGGAEVSVPSLGLRTMADSAGRFRIPGIVAGRRAVLIRHLGFGPLRTALEFADADTVEIDVSLTISLEDMTAVEVVESPSTAFPLVEFERRRATATGAYLTADEIGRLSHGRLSDALGRLPGVNFATGIGGGVYLKGGRGSNSRTRSCFTAVMLDGVWVYDGDRTQTPFNVNSIIPTDIAAVEYYRGLSNTPVELQGIRESCGVLVIWTK